MLSYPCGLFTQAPKSADNGGHREIITEMKNTKTNVFM